MRRTTPSAGDLLERSESLKQTADTLHTPEQASAFIHASDCLAMAANARERGDETLVELWLESAEKELALVNMAAA